MLPAPRATSPDLARTGCPQVLEAVARITQAHDTELMRQRLAESLTEIFPVTGMRFLTPGAGGRMNQPMSCEVRGANGARRLVWDLEPRRNIAASGALARCLSERRHVYPQASQNLDYFPIDTMHGVIEVMEIRQQLSERAERELFGRVMQIYTNFVRVLHEREVDQLTNVYNRGAFDCQLGMTAQSLRGEPRKAPHQPQWWLLMLDVDHFKAINDRYGHLVGDEVLLLLARMMKNSFRGVDRIYRYGGEEFAVLLSPCTRDNALKSAERVREKIETSHFPQVGRITISGGLASVSHYDHTANIVGRADQALYRAKREGRNRICEYDERRQSLLRPGLQSVGSLEIFS